MKKKYGKTKAISRADAQRKKLIALLIGILVVVGGIGVALSAAQNNMNNDEQPMTEEQTQMADIVAQDGGVNKELTTSTSPIGDTGAVLYNSDAFAQTGLNPNDLATPPEEWSANSLAVLKGFELRFNGITQGTSNAESFMWFDTNNTEHTYLRVIHNGTNLSVASVSKEVYDEATKNMYRTQGSTEDAQAIEALSRVQFFDMTNAPVSAEEIAASFDSFNTSGNFGITNVSYVQCSGSTGGINMWFTTNSDSCKYLLCQLKNGSPSWGQVENLGNLNLGQTQAAENAVAGQSGETAQAQ